MDRANTQNSKILHLPLLLLQAKNKMDGPKPLQSVIGKSRPGRWSPIYRMLGLLRPLV